MELGILAWLRLAWRYLDHLPKPKDDDCNVLSDDLCEILNKDPFTIVLSIWAAFQLTWVTMLLCVQLLQIARNLTTYESMRGHLNSHTAADAVTSPGAALLRAFHICRTSSKRPSMSHEV